LAQGCSRPKSTWDARRSHVPTAQSPPFLAPQAAMGACGCKSSAAAPAACANPEASVGKTIAQQVEPALEGAKEAAGDAAQVAGEACGKIVELAKDTAQDPKAAAQDALETGAEAAAEVKDAAIDAGEAAGAKLEQVSSEVKAQLDELPMPAIDGPASAKTVCCGQ